MVFSRLRLGVVFASVGFIDAYAETSEIINFGGGKKSESADSEAVVGDFADACSLEGLDRQSDAS